MTTPADTIRRAIEQYRGDNLPRARAMWRNITQEQMSEPYGYYGGQTRASILAEYEQHERECDVALAYLETMR